MTPDISHGPTSMVATSNRFECLTIEQIDVKTKSKVPADFWENYKVVSSPMDGHCMLHSIVTSYNEQLDRNDMSIKSLTDLLQIQSNDLIDKYCVATNNSITDFHSLQYKYIHDKNYNTNYADVVPIILSDALSINLNIIDKRENSTFDLCVIGNHDIGIYVYKDRDHYDGLSPIVPISHMPSKDLPNMNNQCTDTRNDGRPQHSIYPLSQEDTVPELITELIQFRMKHKNRLTFGHLNINSIKSKYDEVSDILNRKLIDVLAFSETKIDDSYTNSRFSVDDYNIYRADRSDKGGGVMCYVKSSIPHRPRHDISINTDNIESVIIDIRQKSYKCFIVAIYRSPSTPYSVLEEKLTIILDKCFNECENVYVIGDLNVNFLNSKHAMTELLDLYSLKNIVKGPTCFKSIQNATLLDVILTSNMKTVAGHLNIGTGISDFHNLICAATKAYVPEVNRCHIIYRSYKYFNEELFLKELSCVNAEQFFSPDPDIYMENYMTYLTHLIDKYAPIKKRVIKSNQVPYMNSDLRKAINVKGMLYRKYMKNRNIETWEAYREQRNKVNKLKRLSISKHFELKCNTGNNNSKTFWEIMKPFFNNKCTGSRSKINLMENNSIITDTEKICDIFNQFFIDTALQVADDSRLKGSGNDKSFENSGPVNAIRNAFCNTSPFNFSNISNKDVYKKLRSINPKKAAGYDMVPAKLVKLAALPISKHLTPIINHAFSHSIFPKPLKYADVSPVFKKADNLDKTNFRPISVLSILSKVFEGIMADQMNGYFGNILSNWLSAYRSHYSCNNVLLSFVEYIRQGLDKNEHVGCLLMDLSKAFDCLDHDLLIAKLDAYGLSNSSCKLIKSYLSDRKQRVKIQNTYSKWIELKVGVPQGSILGPLLFNIFINDIFLSIDPEVKLYNYADDNTLVFSHRKKSTMVSHLENAAQQAINWFNANAMKANPNKFQFLYLNRNKKDPIDIHLQGSSLMPDPVVKLLGVQFDDLLLFDTHISTICSKAAKQINVLRRLSKHLNSDSKMKIYNSFIQCIFNYCPIVYNTYSIQLSRKLEKLQERALRFVLSDFTSSYNELLEKASKPSLLQMRNQATVEQVFKVQNNLARPMPPDYFKKHTTHYSLRRNEKLYVPSYNTVKYGKNSFRHTGPQLWNQLSNDVKMSKDLTEFKTKIKDWKGPECKCGFCFACSINYR